MRTKSQNLALALLFAALILFVIAGCGGSSGGGNSFVAPNSADLSLTKSVDNPTPDIGAPVVFTITVSNAGPVNATGVIVTDLLPSGFAYDSDDSGSYNPATGVWSVGTVVIGSSQTLNITADVNDTGNYTNIAEITASNQPDPDSNPGNGVPNEDDIASAIAAPPGIDVVINQIQTDCGNSPMFWRL